MSFATRKPNAADHAPNAGQPSKSSAPLILDFADNQLLAELVGGHDQHLDIIEKRLGVSITPRGNRFIITGSPEDCHLAQKVLADLYKRLERGMGVEPGDVDGALNMVDRPWADAVDGNTTRSKQPGDQKSQKNYGSMSDQNLVIRTKQRSISPRTPGQVAYIHALRDNQLVFGIGPAGTGKTYMAVAKACEKMANGEVDRIILSRPAVEAGERLGFLPGDMRDKVDPYLRPLYDALYDMLPAEQVARKLESGEIEVAPLAFMRGRTLSNAVVILDEAQNCTPGQMKMFLTRLGENSQMVVTGDPTQIDLPMGSKSGLLDAQDTLHNVEGVGHVRFTDADVVRHPLVTRIVKAYDSKAKNLLQDK